MMKEQLQAQGKEAPDLFDSNAISPGTNFMFELNRQLEYFVQYKINTDPMYKRLEVVLSDSSVPGEGEHKMMDYIRQAKTHQGYDPNTRHCFYGADADLIMLSLLTHEPNFMIIREEHVIKKTKQGGVQRLDIQKTFNFQLIFISLLREYFQLEYSSLATQMHIRFDLERVIDDFVFFCFFIGNDFLPSLSALDISEGSLDSLIDLYKQLLPSMPDYITEAGKIYWDRA
jgi:5'-3' exoribonuclease 1